MLETVLTSLIKRRLGLINKIIVIIGFNIITLKW
jgi:hypothetical protein